MSIFQFSKLDFVLQTGNGAWRKWKYSIQYDSRNITGISDTEYVIENLRPSTFYNIQVRAYVQNHFFGPLSPPVKGRTLRESGHNISFYWSAHNGLYETNAIGENVQLLVPTNNISMLTWFDDSVVYALNNGSVFLYESEASRVAVNSNLSPKAIPISDIKYAKSLAYDYIGQKLYWSNPKEQSMFRCNMKLSSTGARCELKERLPIVTMAWEMALDCPEGLLIWTTGHSLEKAKLNGQYQGTLYQTGLFSGVRILGITLDTYQSRIYWVSRSAAGSTLQRLGYNIKSAQLPMVIEKSQLAFVPGKKECGSITSFGTYFAGKRVTY